MPGTASTPKNNLATKKNTPSNSSKEFRLRGSCGTVASREYFELRSGRIGKHLSDKDAIAGEFIGC